MVEILILFTVSFAFSAALTFFIQRKALSLGFIDTPNQRSSHTKITPRGGGLSIFICSECFLLFVSKGGSFDFTSFQQGLVMSAGLVGLISLLDDRWELGAKVRFAAQWLAALLLLLWLLPFNFNDYSFSLSNTFLLFFVYGLCIVWLTNLYNFMDGIDGLAATQSVCVLIGGLLLLYLNTGWQDDGWQLSLYMVVLLAACLGFLLFNWPSATIFMGDIGSCYLGFVFAGMIVFTVSLNLVSLYSWVILLALFWVDATLTLLWRIYLRKAWLEAHSEHLYQVLARRFKSHKKVTIFAIIINALWLLPLAVMANYLPEIAWIITIVSIVPLIGVQFKYALLVKNNY